MLAKIDEAPKIPAELPSLLPWPQGSSSGWYDEVEYEETGFGPWRDQEHAHKDPKPDNAAVHHAPHVVGVPRRAEMLSVQGQLLALNAQEDPETILVVKEPLVEFCTVPLTEALLASHFQQFGDVQRVHIHIRNLTRRDIARRGMPLSTRSFFRLGFVVMQTPDGVQRALMSGEEHIIGDCAFRVEKFRERQRCFSAGGGAT